MRDVDDADPGSARTGIGQATVVRGGTETTVPRDPL
jgi:hypothetical protein